MDSPNPRIPNIQRSALLHSDKDELVVDDGQNYTGGVKICGQVNFPQGIVGDDRGDLLLSGDKSVSIGKYVDIKVPETQVGTVESKLCGLEISYEQKIVGTGIPKTEIACKASSFISKIHMLFKVPFLIFGGLL